MLVTRCLCLSPAAVTSAGSVACVGHQVSLSVPRRSDKCWECRLRLSFLPAHMYASEFAVTPPDILAAVERRFLRRVQDAINRKITELKTTRWRHRARSASRSVDHLAQCICCRAECVLSSYLLTTDIRGQGSQWLIKIREL